MTAENWRIIDSQYSNDPAINLALEEYAVRNLDHKFNYLLFYINRAAVILGRHQNVLQEVNLLYCWQKDVPIIRRISGGGTVFHDMGNLNMAFICDYSLKGFNRYRRFLVPIVGTLRSLGADVQIDERNNLRIGKAKISGNAQFSSRGRLLSHGTLLVESDLDQLNAVLKPEQPGLYQTRATRSLRSIVTNLSDHLPERIETDRLREILLGTFFKGREMEMYTLSDQQWGHVEELAERKYRSWKWNIGESPPINVQKVINLNGEFVEIKYGISDGCFTNLKIDHPCGEPLIPMLTGMPLRQDRFAEVVQKINPMKGADKKAVMKILYQLFS